MDNRPVLKPGSLIVCQKTFHKIIGGIVGNECNCSKISVRPKTGAPPFGANFEKRQTYIDR